MVGYIYELNERYGSLDHIEDAELRDLYGHLMSEPITSLLHAEELLETHPEKVAVLHAMNHALRVIIFGYEDHKDPTRLGGKDIAHYRAYEAKVHALLKDINEERCALYETFHDKYKEGLIDALEHKDQEAEKAAGEEQIVGQFVSSYQISAEMFLKRFDALSSINEPSEQTQQRVLKSVHSTFHALLAIGDITNAKLCLEKYFSLGWNKPQEYHEMILGNALFLARGDDGIRSGVLERLPGEIRNKDLAFNLACTHSVLDEKDVALGYLRMALDLGIGRHKLRDADFNNLTELEEFKALL